MNERIVIGKIIGAHGIRGEVKVFPITDNVRRFNKLRSALSKKKTERSSKNLMSGEQGSIRRMRSLFLPICLIELKLRN